VLVAWQRRPAFQVALAADLVVEAAHTSAEQRLAHRRGRRGEADEQVITRATEARSRSRPSDAVDGACQRLLAAAIRQLQLTTEQVTRMLSVAQSVAQLAVRRRSSRRIWPKRSSTGRALRHWPISWSQARQRRNNRAGAVSGIESDAMPECGVMRAIKRGSAGTIARAPPDHPPFYPLWGTSQHTPKVSE